MKNMALYWWNEDPGYQPPLHPSPGFGKVETVWDRYNDLYILERVTDKEVITDFYNARIEELTGGCEWSDKTHGMDEDGWPDVGSKPSVTVIRFFVTDDLLWEERFKQWLQGLVEQSDGVTSDDSYFDYLPDLWDIALQICDIQGWLDDYDEAVTHLVEETDFCDDRYEGQIKGVMEGGTREFFGPARQA